MSRHEFLASLHELLQPRVYLEIGVQTGASLVLAERAEMAVGVDPEPLISMSPNQRPNQIIYNMTSDAFFASGLGLPPVDLAFIDGMHLVEYAFRDFLNVQKLMRPGGVIVFDDVLPYNSAIADRVQPPGGDWTGDVWKLWYVLRGLGVGLEPTLVDTWPTGTMVLMDVEPSPSLLELGTPSDYWTEDEPVPGPILRRDNAVHPSVILEKIRERVA